MRKRQTRQFAVVRKRRRPMPGGKGRLSSQARFEALAGGTAGTEAVQCSPRTVCE